MAPAFSARPSFGPSFGDAGATTSTSMAPVFSAFLRFLMASAASPTKATPAPHATPTTTPVLSSPPVEAGISITTACSVTELTSNVSNAESSNATPLAATNSAFRSVLNVAVAAPVSSAFALVATWSAIAFVATETVISNFTPDAASRLRAVASTMPEMAMLPGLTVSLAPSTFLYASCAAALNVSRVNPPTPLVNVVLCVGASVFAAAAVVDVVVGVAVAVGVAVVAAAVVVGWNSVLAPPLQVGSVADPAFTPKSAIPLSLTTAVCWKVPKASYPQYCVDCREDMLASYG